MFWSVVDSSLSWNVLLYFQRFVISNCSRWIKFGISATSLCFLSIRCVGSKMPFLPIGTAGGVSIMLISSDARWINATHRSHHSTTSIQIQKHSRDVGALSNARHGRSIKSFIYLQMTFIYRHIFLGTSTAFIVCFMSCVLRELAWVKEKTSCWIYNSTP